MYCITMLASNKNTVPRFNPHQDPTAAHCPRSRRCPCCSLRGTCHALGGSTLLRSCYLIIWAFRLAGMVESTTPIQLNVWVRYGQASMLLRPALTFPCPFCSSVWSLLYSSGSGSMSVSDLAGVDTTIHLICQWLGLLLSRTHSSLLPLRAVILVVYLASY